MDLALNELLGTIWEKHARIIRQELREETGRTAVRFAASNVDVNSGSALDVQWGLQWKYLERLVREAVKELESRLEPGEGTARFLAQQAVVAASAIVRKELERLPLPSLLAGQTKDRWEQHKERLALHLETVAETELRVIASTPRLRRPVTLAGGGGTLLFSSFERPSRRGPSFALSWQWVSPGFLQLGMQPGQPAPLRVLTGFAGLPLAGYGSIGISYLRRDDRGAPGSEIVSASYTVGLARSVALSVAALRSLSGEPVQSVVVGLSTAFGERSSALLDYSQQPHSSQALLQVQQNLPAGTGAGYRVLAGAGSPGDREEGTLLFQGDKGTYEVGAARGPSYVESRASMSGSVVLIGGQPFFTRRLVDSFGVAEVPGFREVTVSVNNQIVGRTNGDGYVMLPHLMPYQANEVRIEPSDLPIDARIDATRLDAVPYFRSGLSLRFPVQRSNGALLVVLLEDGTPIPSGAVVRIEGREEEFPVAERGEVYVTGLAQENKVRVFWRGDSCELDVRLKEGESPLPKLGPFTCKGVTR